MLTRDQIFVVASVRGFVRWEKTGLIERLSLSKRDIVRASGPFVVSHILASRRGFGPDTFACSRCDGVGPVDEQIVASRQTTFLEHALVRDVGYLIRLR